MSIAGLTMLFSFIISTVLNKKFDKYSKIPSTGGMTGADIAKRMLLDNGITDVKVESVQGKLTDFYNPQTKTVNLSEGVYGSASIAAAAVAAHETGHAIQHAMGYGPLKMRTAFVPVVTFANKFVMWVLLAGTLLIELIGPAALWPGIILFGITTIFSIITLPVEINASQRAVMWLESAGVADAQTKPMAVDALKWAAYTYIIAAIGSLAQLIYYIAMAAGSRRRW